MTRFRCTCAYDGTEFNGWQSQPTGRTVQDTLERRLTAIFKTPIRIHGSGRTDAGVHARAQEFHFDAEWPHPEAHLLRALGSNLPQTLRVYRVRSVEETFHARYSATRKRYSYTLFMGEALPFDNRWCWSLGRRRPDLDLMRVCAAQFLGEHDFRGYAARRNDGSDAQMDPVRQCWRADIRQSGRRVRVILEANGFLYKMARSMVGALVEVGLGRLSPETLVHILHTGERTHEVPTAPAHGLCLERVDYGKT